MCYLNVTSFGNSFCRYSQVNMKSYWLEKTSIQWHCPSKKRGHRQSPTEIITWWQRKRQEWPMSEATNTEDSWQLPEATKGQKGKRMPMVWFQDSSLQSYKAINTFLLFEVTQLVDNWDPWIRQPWQTNVPQKTFFLIDLFIQQILLNADYMTGSKLACFHLPPLLINISFSGDRLYCYTLYCQHNDIRRRVC